MTYIEFYDENCINNYCSSLICPPERLIILGDKKNRLEKFVSVYREMMQAHGQEVEVSYRVINRNSIEKVRDELQTIVDTYPDCVIDLTGGEEICLTAAGMLFAQNPDKNIQMHKFNLISQRIYDCDFDGKTIGEMGVPGISVEDNIRIYGGGIVYDEDRQDTTPLWDINEEFENDIITMWHICKQDVKVWNRQCGYFAQIEGLRSEEEDSLTTVIGRGHFQRSLGAPDYFLSRVAYALQECDLIRLEMDEFHISITYKDAQVKKCLMKAGNILEMAVFVFAMHCYEEDGTYTYYDGLNGVVIDWDGDIFSDGSETINEVDVILTRGMVPIFISCKNGEFDINELYKLNTIAERFGGKYAKKVLIATSIDPYSQFERMIMDRANEMRIRVITDLQRIDDEEAVRRMQTLWLN